MTINELEQMASEEYMKVCDLNRDYTDRLKAQARLDEIDRALKTLRNSKNIQQ